MKVVAIERVAAACLSGLLREALQDFIVDQRTSPGPPIWLLALSRFER